MNIHTYMNMYVCLKTNQLCACVSVYVCVAGVVGSVRPGLGGWPLLHLLRSSAARQQYHSLRGPSHSFAPQPQPEPCCPTGFRLHVEATMPFSLNIFSLFTQCLPRRLSSMLSESSSVARRNLALIRKWLLRCLFFIFMWMHNYFCTVVPPPSISLSITHWLRRLDFVSQHFRLSSCLPAVLPSGSCVHFKLHFICCPWLTPNSKCLFHP